MLALRCTIKQLKKIFTPS